MPAEIEARVIARARQEHYDQLTNLLRSIRMNEPADVERSKEHHPFQDFEAD